jgi:tryptophan synthase beta chain
MQLAKTMRTDQSILVNLSGRGDKDIGTVADLSNADFFCRPSCQGQSVKGNTINVPVALVKPTQPATFSGASQ